MPRIGNKQVHGRLALVRRKPTPKHGHERQAAVADSPTSCLGSCSSAPTRPGADAHSSLLSRVLDIRTSGEAGDRPKQTLCLFIAVSWRSEVTERWLPHSFCIGPSQQSVVVHERETDTDTDTQARTHIQIHTQRRTQYRYRYRHIHTVTNNTHVQSYVRAQTQSGTERHKMSGSDWFTPVR